MTKRAPITLEYARVFFHVAKSEFEFLTSRGFELTEEEPPSSVSFRDGFHLLYVSRQVSVAVDYYDMELLPVFHRAKEQAGYFFIDRYIFSNASGYSGAMFPLDKLANALHVVARDIQQHYDLILSGDDAMWQNILAMFNAPTRKRTLP